MQTASLRADKPIVILTGPSLAAQTSTSICETIAHAVSPALGRIKRSVAPHSIFRAVFCEKASMAVAFIVVAAMWWHAASIDDRIASGEAIAADCLFGMPWAIAWAVRSTIAECKKGGAK